jgi:hypothetical protein
LQGNDFITRFTIGLSDMAKRYLKLNNEECKNGDSELKTFASNGSVKKSLELTRNSKQSLAHFHTDQKSKNEVVTVARPNLNKPQRVQQLKDDLQKQSHVRMQHILEEKTTSTLAQRIPIQKEEEPQKSTLISAQRVPKNPIPITEVSKSRLKPAQRVLSNSIESIPVKESITSTQEPAPAEKSEKRLSLPANPKIPLPKSENGRPTIIKRQPLVQKPVLYKSSSLSILEKQVATSDWLKRAKVYQSLKSQIEQEKDLDYSTPTSQKACQLLVNGLNDQHFRVVADCLSCISLFLSSPCVPQNVLDKLFPRTLAVGYNPSIKIKPSIIQKCLDVVTQVFTNIDGNMVGACIVYAFSHPIFSAKVRIGTIGFLATLTNEQLLLLFSKESRMLLINP